MHFHIFTLNSLKMATFKSLSLALFLICLSISEISSGELPSFIHVCHRGDAAHLEQCLMVSVEELRPYLVTGVPEYNIPSLEPLVLNDLISEDLGGVKITTSNVTAYGCSDFFVRGLTLDLDKHLYEVHIDLPKLRIFANYTIDGKLLMLNLRGSGNLETNITDCISKSRLQGEFYEKDGEKHLRFVSVDLKVQIGGGKVRVEKLFSNNDKIVLSVVNDVVNKNLDSFLKELMPSIQKGLSQKFLEIANDIVQPFTYEQLFPL